MNMNRKTLILLAVVLLMMASVVKLCSDVMGEQTEYTLKIQQAQKYADDELYEKAIQTYEEAVAISPEQEAYLSIGNLYCVMEEYTAAENTGEEILSLFPYSPDSYAFMARVYVTEEKYSQLNDLYKQMLSAKVTSDEVKTMLSDVYNEWHYGFTTATEVGAFSGELCAYKTDKGWGYISTTDSVVVRPKYSSASPFSTSTAAVCEDGTWFILNLEGIKQLNLSSVIEGCEDVGMANYDLLPICVNGQYGYYTDTDYQLVFGSYDWAGTFSSGVAAVRNGSDWYLVNTEGKTITEAFSSILTDDRGMACRSERCFAETKNGYILLDNTGTRVGTETYEDACPFTADKVAAVCIGGLWGFIDENGNTLIEPSFKNARSFSNGYAAVEYDDDLWGYIDLTGQLVIQDDFTDARDFNSNGSAFVKSYDAWREIILYRYESEAD